MKKIFFTASILGLIIAFPSDNITLKENSNKSRFAKDHIIVKLKKNNDNLAASLQSSYRMKINCQNVQRIKYKYRKTKKLFPKDLKHNTALYSRYELETYYVVFFDNQENIKELCNKVSGNLSVDFSEPDFIGEAGR